MRLIFQSDGGIKPTKAHSSDAGFDLYAIKNYEVTAKEATLIDLRIRILIPAGFTGLILPRSGLSSKGVTAAIGVIDSGYTGRIKVSMSCIAGTYHVHAGDRIAQLVILPLARAHLEDGNVELLEASRGAKGFGSSGL